MNSNANKRPEASGAFLACPGVLCTFMLQACGLNEATDHFKQS